MCTYKIKEKNAKFEDKKLQKISFSFHIGVNLAGNIAHLTKGHTFDFWFQ